MNCTAMADEQSPRRLALVRGALLAVVLSTLAACGVPARRGEAEPAPRAQDASSASSAPQDPWLIGETRAQGITVRCRAIPLGAERRGDAVTGAGVLTGDDVRIEFEIVETSSGQPVTNLTPAAWIDGGRPTGEGDGCGARIAAYLSATLSTRAEFDLTTFHVVTLDEEPTLSVIDPLFEYGGSRLLDLVALPCAGADWVQCAERSRIYVSLPLVNQVAAVDTNRWRVTRLFDVGTGPGRLWLQPDGRRLWVGCLDVGADGESGSLYVIDLEGEAVVGRHTLGPARAALAFSDDSLRAYACAHGSSALRVIDTHEQIALGDVDLGAPADELLFSPVSQAVYALSGRAGEIVVVDAQEAQVRHRVPCSSGGGVARLVPDTRFILVADPHRNEVRVVDSSLDAVVQTAQVRPDPDQIAFTEGFAYIRCRGSEQVVLIPLDQLGRPDTPLMVMEVPGGATPFGMESAPSRAAGIVATPGGGGALIANPVDRAIYYYMEGMSAPMGSFQHSQREPRGVLVVDRSLVEECPGVYRSMIAPQEPGEYTVSFLLDYPALSECFALDIGAAPRSGEEIPAVRPAVAARLREAGARRVAGEEILIDLDVRDGATGGAIADLKDLGVVAFAAGGWQQRAWARPRDDGGYAVSIVPPAAGTYYILSAIPSLRFEYRDSPRLVVRVHER